MTSGGRASLLDRLERIITRTYDLETGIADLSDFIIGDEGYLRLYDGAGCLRSVGSGLGSSGSGAADPAGARMLLRQSGKDLKACLYYPDRLIDNLERHDPERTLSEANVDDFATLVEELDHLLTIADRHRAGAEVSLLELELHANVTKELVLRLFVARGLGRSRLGRGPQSWIRHHLFGKIIYGEADLEVRARYRDAATMALRYLDALYRLPASERPRELRRFHRRSHHEKLAGISRL